MVLLAGIDPLKWGQELLVCAVAIIALSLIYVYWNRFVFLLTGDDRLHCSSLQFVWSCMRCGGYCTGEWTRPFSKVCCCLCPSWRNSNVIQKFGQMVGWATYSIELKNITVGDLPFDEGRGDFYLSIEASTNPPIVTALQEEKLPKVVHFPEIIALKIRDSVLEKRVRICVKELNVVGSVDICDCHLSSTALIDWACQPIQETRVKRFQMRPCDNSIERETPSWLLVEFGVSDDVRGVDSIGSVSAATQFVRTWVPTDHETVQMTDAQPLAYHDGARLGGSMWTNAPRQNVDLQVNKFKGAYQLLDDAGNPIQEPPESALAKLRNMRRCAMCVFGLFQFFVWFLIIGWCCFRFYIWSCYRHFQWITIAKLRAATFPISVANLHEYVKDCHQKFDGTGLSRGTGPTTALADACRPNQATILDTCINLPVGQPRPEAFNVLMKEYFGITIQTGVGCFDGICSMRSKIAEYDHTMLVLGFALFCSTFICRKCMNDCIRAAKRSDQAQAQEAQKRRLGNPYQ